MAPSDTPAAELTVDVDLVRRLLADQHPDLADLPLRLVANGWDNVVFRLGDDLAVRVPRRALAAPLIVNELHWLPQLTAGLPLPTSCPVRAGRPGAGYPWAWAVVPWRPGRIAATTALADPSATADVLGRFVAAFARPAPPDAPANPFRGVPLAQRQAAVLERIAYVDAPVDRDAARDRWAAAMAAPVYTGPPVWLHGDLHPANLLVDDDGRLSCVIDFGDLTAGDPATDLSVAWMLFGPADRDVFRAAGGVDDATWTRAMGNALAHGLACLASSADDPIITGMGRRTVAAVVADGG